MSKDISRPRPRNTVDREAFRDMCRAFAQREIGPRWQKADADKQFPRDFLPRGRRSAQRREHIARDCPRRAQFTQTATRALGQDLRDFATEISRVMSDLKVFHSGS